MEIIEKFLTVNHYSRPGRKRAENLGIVMHWTGRPEQNEDTVRNFFERICPRDKHFSSAHYIIGQKGRILYVVPEAEVAYHTGSATIDPASGKVYTDEARRLFGKYANTSTLSPNSCSIGIELCPASASGRFSDDTLDAARQLVRSILKRWNAGLDVVTTHNAIVGWKDCPRYWVNNPKEFEAWKKTL